MIELRSPRPEELDEMLAVMCEAFHLPFGPARDIFYRDPYFDVRRKRVLTVDGRIASCLTVVDAPTWIGSAVVPVAGVAGVATRLEDRNQGYATQLLQDAIPALRELGYGLAALFAVSPGFYRRLGWEAMTGLVHLGLPLSAIPATRESRYVRAALPSDSAEVARLYDRWSQGRTGCRGRDERRWRYLCEHVTHRVVYKRGAVEGYALYDIKEVADSRTNVRLLEMVAESEAAHRGLTAHLAQRKECESIDFTAGWRELRETGLLRLASAAGDDFAPRGTLRIVQGPLARIIDFERLLGELTANWTGFSGSITLVRRDLPSTREGTAAVTVTGHEGEVEVRAATEGENTRSRIEGNNRAWTAVAMGHSSLADAIAEGRLRASSDVAAALAAPLFPRRELYVPTADYF